MNCQAAHKKRAILLAQRFPHSKIECLLAQFYQLPHAFNHFRGEINHPASSLDALSIRIIFLLPFGTRLFLQQFAQHTHQLDGKLRRHTKTSKLGQLKIQYTNQRFVWVIMRGTAITIFVSPTARLISFSAIKSCSQQTACRLNCTSICGHAQKITKSPAKKELRSLEELAKNARRLY